MILFLGSHRNDIRALCKSLTVILATFLLVCFHTEATAADPALIRVEPAAEGEVWVGQKVTFTVELFSEDLFSGSPYFDIPKVSGIIVMKIEGRPVMGSKKIDQTTYNSQLHEFAAFAQRAGEIVIPSFEVRFSSKKPAGSDETSHAFSTPELRFDAKMPPGAEGLSTIISANDLNVKETWSPQPGDTADVGDAFIRTVSMTASNIPAMVFPPWPDMEVTGLGIYAKTPVVQDKSQRGVFTGERVERITYVCETPGQVVVPAVLFHWWDLKGKELKQVEMPEVSFDVLGAPDASPEESASKNLQEAKGRKRIFLWLGMLILAVLSIIITMFRKRISLWISGYNRRRTESEKARFNHLLKACRSDKPVTAFNALTIWLDGMESSPETPTISGYLNKYSDPELKDGLIALQAAVVHTEREWSGAHLEAVLKKHRKARQSREKAKKASPLPELNPIP